MKTIVLAATILLSSCAAQRYEDYMMTPIVTDIMNDIRKDITDLDK